MWTFHIFLLSPNIREIDYLMAPVNPSIYGATAPSGPWPLS